MLSISNEAWAQRQATKTEAEKRASFGTPDTPIVSRQKMWRTLEWLSRLTVPPSAFVLVQTEIPDRVQAKRDGHPVPGHDDPGTEDWVWHLAAIRTHCPPLGGAIILTVHQAMAAEASAKLARDFGFVIRQVRAVAKGTLQLRDQEQ